MNIKEELLDYINQKEQNGALLLTGKWGCGKSYLVRDVAKELNESKKAAVAFVSLFGLDSVAAINRRVKEEYTCFMLSSMGKATPKVAKAFTTIVKDSLHVASIASSGNPALSAASQGLSSVLSYDLLGFFEISNTIGKDKNSRKFVLVFDDLERSGLEKKNLLGTLNEYVENRRIKVIIIADEDKIANDDYREYKEKLIARTIKMSANYETLIEQIIDDYSETEKGYKTFLKDNTDLLKQVFLESKSDNLRTFKTAIADFERVYGAWAKTEVPVDNMKWVLYTFASDVFISKALLGTKPANQEEGSEAYHSKRREQQFVSKGKNESSFYSLSNWINKGVWEAESFVEELSNKYSETEKTPVERFLAYTIWALEQKDIDEGFPAAIKLACKGELSCSDMLSLLSKIHILREHSPELPCKVNYKELEEGFKQRMEGIKQETIHEPRCNRFLMNDQIDNEAKTVYKMVDRMENLIPAWNNRRLFIDLICGKSSSTERFQSGLYVDEFDDELLELFKKQYLEACNFEKREYANALMSLAFDSSSYSTDENIRHSRDNFHKLIDWLNSNQTNDIVAAINNKYLIQWIQESEIMKNKE